MAEKWSERGVADTIHESLVIERLDEGSEEHAAMLELRDEERVRPRHVCQYNP